MEGHESSRKREKKDGQKGAGEHDRYVHPTWGGGVPKALAMSNILRKGRGGRLEEEVLPRP